MRRNDSAPHGGAACNRKGSCHNPSMTTSDPRPSDAPPAAHPQAPARNPLDAFRDQVLADPLLREELLSPDDAEQFVALVVRTAAARSIALDPQSVRAAMQSHVPGMGAIAGPDEGETPLPPAGWLPIGTSWGRGGLCVRWSYFGERRLREPFFQGDAQRAQFKPFNRLIRPLTPIAALAGWLEQRPPLRPDGFIFHMSRCGSTLVAQMLVSADNVVISEAGPIDDVVRARQVRPDLSEDEQARWLAWIVGAIGQPRAGERRLFVKLDCWHTLALPLFRRAFPGVPWVFLYRDPVEVMVSQRQMPGMQMIPGALGPELLGIAPSHDQPDDYCARVLARICEPIEQEHARGGGLLVNYRDLPAALWTTILPHFDVAASAEERAAMAETAKYDAKMPGFEFTPDAQARQRTARPATRAAAAEWLADIYDRLEALRLGGRPGPAA
jgi:hypothetical protein